MSRRIIRQIEERAEIEPEYISYKLEGEEANRFRAFKKRLNLKTNSEVARKALFDQIEISERREAA